MNNKVFTPLKDYFILGDLHSAALLNNKGSIDWLCWPHFDSPSVFSAILDAKKGGSFLVDMKGWSTEVNYRERTAMVDTVFSSGDKSFKVTDFMVPQLEEEKEVMHLLIRKFSAASEHTEVKLVFNLRPEYGQEAAEIRREGRMLVVSLGEHNVALHMPTYTKVRIEKKIVHLSFTLDPGECKQLVLEYGKSDYSYDGEDYEKGVEHYWHKWVKLGNYEEACEQMLIRSAITLKLMQFYPTGALIASPTASLPEAIKGERNWDYRYVWVRDATLTLYGLQLLGHTEEAARFFRFIEKVTKESDTNDVHIKLMYSISGLKPPEERELPHLGGYRGSKPVRIGNGARNQWQLDVYGSVIDAYYFMYRKGILPTPPSRVLMLHLAKRIEESFMEKDSGIWEVRHEVHRFTYSRVMCWVGIDRLVSMSKELSFSDEEVRHYTVLREKIREWIWEHCYDPKRKIFKQHPNGVSQDATTFMFVLVHFLDRKDPLTKEIIANAAEELVEDDIFVYRYHSYDGFDSHEGAFFLCTYWYISALAAIGELEKAEKIFDKLSSKLAKNGLIAEEVDCGSSDYLGNHPQAFSHIGYIMAVHYISRAKEKRKKNKK